LYVYENRDVLPRYNFVGSVQLCDGDDATLAALGHTKARDFLKCAVLDRRDAKNISADQFHGATGEVTLISRSSDDLELEVRCDGPGLVVVANTYSANWRAEIDGQPAEILPADYTFQGVRVEKGSHRLHFHYRGADRWATLWAHWSRKDSTTAN
jgi:hypothetical protein